MVKSEGKLVGECFHIFPEFFQGVKGPVGALITKTGHNQLY